MRGTNSVGELIPGENDFFSPSRAVARHRKRKESFLANDASRPKISGVTRGAAVSGALKGRGASIRNLLTPPRCLFRGSRLVLAPMFDSKLSLAQRHRLPLSAFDFALTYPPTYACRIRNKAETEKFSRRQNVFQTGCQTPRFLRVKQRRIDVIRIKRYFMRQRYKIKMSILVRIFFQLESTIRKAETALRRIYFFFLNS